ncbi:hypothetical protein [Acinetobacter sp. SWAC57]|uniref:hypothetical protein n=1 Tax=Acinetobacter sp. SWAC57 TaxID=2293834 RepID=UPI000E5C5090|nr:hypothetical protein [Acinetobacter sp. SWAC57]RGD90535.1 hypothetical protein DYI96_10200 [Acinetobacter sp. SWAC57]
MITRLPCRFTNLFTYWLYRDGYRSQVKKDAVVLRRGDSVLKIFCHKGREQQDYLMDEACQRKFKQFCRCYLNGYSEFLINLAREARVEFTRSKNFNYLMVA